ncbi:MAG: porin [Muribaculaceae bacterium]|nr:porin [Muribaculaceae bacterium]
MNKAIFLTILAGVANIGFAQNHPAKSNESQEIHTIGFTPADSAAVYKAFVENAPKRFQIAGAPRFAIIGKDEKFYLGIGGTAKGVVGFDFPNPISNEVYFTTSSIPMSQAAGNGGHFWINGQQTNVYLNAVALPGTDNQLGFYFNFDLCGNNYSPVIQYAYLTYRGFLVGYNTSLFYDGNACGPGIDKEGPNSLTWALNSVVDYTHAFKNGITLAIGAEIGTYSYTTNKYTQQVSQRLPDIPAYIQYNFNNNPNSYVRFSALARFLQYRNLEVDKNKTVGGWGIKASGTVPIGQKWQTYFQLGYGKGITGYFEDLNGMNLDLTPNPTIDGKLNAVPSWGGYFGLQYNWNSNWYSSVCYSHLRNYAKKYSSADSPTVDWSSQYRYAQYMALNTFYNINAMLTWGIEWDWGRRADMNGLSKHDNRIQSMLQFNF